MNKETFEIVFTENGKEIGKLTVDQFRSGYKVPKMISLPEAISVFNAENKANGLQASIKVNGK